MGPTVRKRGKLLEKPIEHSLDTFSNLGIREPDRSKTPMHILLVAIPIRRGVVRISVHLHDQRFLRAKEIDDAISDDVLASKLEAAELRSAEVLPKLCLEWRGATPEASCPVH